MADLSFDSVIVIRWDDDEGRIVYDLGPDLDPYAAITIMRQVILAVEDCLPLPRDINDPLDDEEDEDD